MTISDDKKEKIIKLIEDTIENKLKKNENATKANMPFHERLFSKRDLRVSQLIHSINTTLGMSVFEQIVEILAIDNFKTVKSQQIVVNM